MNGAILGMTKAEIDAKMEDIIEFSEVREFIDTPVKRYSSGMYVKLAFSVAAHLDSEIMIMDEVLAVGDMAFQKKCLDKMRDAAKKEGRTVLYVSHNMNTIRQLCDRCIVLDKGKVVFKGEVEKAIGVYLGGNGGLRLKTDCTNMPREPLGDHRVHVNTVELLDMEEPVLYDRNPLRVKIAYTSEQDYPNLMFRMILFSANRLPVGMMTSETVLNAKTGQNVAYLTFDLSVLAPGEYRGRMAFYEVNEYGAEQIHDVVDPGISFRKENKEEVSDTTAVWKSQYWGHINFHEAIVLDETY